MLAVVQENAASLLRIARKHSLCADDAYDAYQRALEIFLRKVDEVAEDSAAAYLRTVVRHEALAIRAGRARFEPVDFDEWETLEADGEERAFSFDQVHRAAEALRHCKRDEVTALVLRAEGNTYQDICAATGWSYTKLNRCLSEGRARFLKRYRSIECGEECERIAPLLSAMADDEATPDEIAEARAHLRNCSGCRATLRVLHESQPAIHAVMPAGLLADAAVVDGGFVSRVYEALADAVIRLQSSVEIVTASKVAAVASAAAVAGGGAVVVQTQQERPATQPVRAKVAQAPTPTPTASPAHIPTPEAAATPRPVVTKPRPPRREPREEQFNFEAAAATEKAPVPDAPAPPKATPSAKQSNEDFGFER